MSKYAVTSAQWFADSMAAVLWLCKGSEIPIFLNKGSVQRMSRGESIDKVQKEIELLVKIPTVT